jgi:hypothetical protein
VQLAFAATLPLASATLVPPALAVTDPAPQVVAALGVPAIVTPAGSVSLSPTPDSATAPGAVFGSVIVNVEMPPDAMLAGENALLRVRAAGVIVRLAVAALTLLTPCVSVNALAGIAFV